MSELVGQCPTGPSVPVFLAGETEGRDGANWLHALCDLEAAGLSFRLGPDASLIVGPKERLDDAARAFIRESKANIVSVLEARPDDEAVDAAVLRICMPRLKRGENRLDKKSGRAV